MSIEAIVILVIAVAVSAYFYTQKQKSEKKSKPVDPIQLTPDDEMQVAIDACVSAEELRDLL